MKNPALPAAALALDGLRAFNEDAAVMAAMNANAKAKRDDFAAWLKAKKKEWKKAAAPAPSYDNPAALLAA